MTTVITLGPTDCQPNPKLWKPSLVFRKEIENSLDRKTKALQCDMGGEYKAFEPFLEQKVFQLRTLVLTPTIKMGRLKENIGILWKQVGSF